MKTQRASLYLSPEGKYTEVEPFLSLVMLLARCVYLQPYNIPLLSSLIFVNNQLLSEPVLSLQLLIARPPSVRRRSFVAKPAVWSFRFLESYTQTCGLIFSSSFTALISVIVAVSDLVIECVRVYKHRIPHTFRVDPFRVCEPRRFAWIPRNPRS